MKGIYHVQRVSAWLVIAQMVYVFSAQETIRSCNFPCSTTTTIDYLTEKLNEIYISNTSLSYSDEQFTYKFTFADIRVKVTKIDPKRRETTAKISSGTMTIRKMVHKTSKYYRTNELYVQLYGNTFQVYVYVVSDHYDARGWTIKYGLSIFNYNTLDITQNLRQLFREKSISSRMNNLLNYFTGQVLFPFINLTCYEPL